MAKKSDANSLMISLRTARTTLSSVLRESETRGTPAKNRPMVTTISFNGAGLSSDSSTTTPAIGPHGSVDRCVLAVLLNQFVGGLVDVDVGGH